MSRFTRIKNLKAVGVILIAGLFAISSNVAHADTKKVQVPANKGEWIDTIAAIDGDSCRSMVSDSKIVTPSKNGRLRIEIVNHKMTDGACRGQTVQVVAVGYQPKRGFRGKDEGTITFRRPPRRYSARQSTLMMARKYLITVE